MNRYLRSSWLTGLAALALGGVAPALASAQTVIRGRVQSDAGQPITGASVGISELGVGTPVNASGAYTFTIPAGRVSGQTVVVRARAIGFKPRSQSVKLEQGATLTADFTMERDVTQLEAVVTTGVATATEQLKVPFTVTRVDTTTMPVVGSSAVSQLQGKVPGALVVSASGRPGGSPSVVLRGPGSLNATGRSQGPLYLIDGVPLQGSLPDLNPADIENIEILKGAAAASLYGARAGAGVIAITTKSGKNSGQGMRFGVRTEGGLGDIEREFPLAKRTNLAMDPSGQYFCSRETVGGSPCGRYIDWDTEVARVNNNGQDFSDPPQRFLRDFGISSAPSYDELTGLFQTVQWPRMRDPVGTLVTPSSYANTNIDMRGRVNNTSVFASFGN